VGQKPIEPWPNLLGSKGGSVAHSTMRGMERCRQKAEQKLNLGRGVHPSAFAKSGHYHLSRMNAAPAPISFAP